MKKLLDKEVERMNQIIMEIPWMSDADGRIYSAPIPASRAVKRIPVSFPTAQEYKTFMEKDDLKGFFGYAFGKEKFTDNEPYQTNWQRKRDTVIILGARMDLIYPDEIYSTAERIRWEFEKKLQCVDGLQVHELIDDDMEKIFEGFDIREFSLEATVFPKVFFRWNCTLTYRECI